MVVNGTVLLTGASGLLGAWLRRNSPRVHRGSRTTHRTRLRDSPEVIADLRDPDAVVAAVHQVRPSLVIHAAYARDRVATVDATQNVVDAAREVGVDVLYVSSDAVFSGDGSPRHEDAPPDPVWDCGRWKAQAERIVSCASATSVIVRLLLSARADASVDFPVPGDARHDHSANIRHPNRMPGAAPSAVRRRRSRADRARGLFRLVAGRLARVCR